MNRLLTEIVTEILLNCFKSSGKYLERKNGQILLETQTELLGFSINRKTLVLFVDNHLVY